MIKRQSDEYLDALLKPGYFLKALFAILGKNKVARVDVGDYSLLVTKHIKGLS